MITYFPEIYPDELLYSWFCRFYVHSGFFTHKAAMQELYCKRSDNPSKEFVGNLNMEVRKQIEQMYSMEELVMKHTMFPQYARFLSVEKKKEALEILCTRSCDIHTLFSVLPREKENQYLKYCPVCVREDREQYGETYWKRKHQLRNISICTRHKCRLINSAITAKSEQTFVFAPAESNVQEWKPVLEDDPMKIHYAEYLETVFAAPIIWENDTSPAAILYHGMIGTEYMKSSGRSRYTQKLADDMKQYYEQIEICDIASIHQIQRTVIGERSDFSVVCQIAFFLGISPEDLIDLKLTKEQLKTEKKSHYAKGRRQIDWKQLDEETAPILERIVRDIYHGTASTRPERVSERSVYRKLGLQQRRLENMPECRKIMEQYAETYPESWARKVIWAYRKLENEQREFFWSEIRNLSGVKKQNIDSIIPYLEKYSNQKMRSKILDLLEGRVER